MDYQAPPIAVQECRVYGSVNSPFVTGTRIVFTNTGATTLHRVTFRVTYHSIDNEETREIEDTGSFAPGARIDHKLDLFNGTTFNGTLPERCVAVGAR